MSKHTPGPFRVIDLRHQKGGQIRIVTDAHPLEGTNEIANVLTRNPSVEANARLFVAAPELLEMVKKFSDRFQHELGSTQYDEVQELIAKAEGKMSEQPKPEVGMGVTQQLIADRHAYQIIEIINHRRIVIRGHGTSKIVHLTLRDDGKWKRYGTDGRGEAWILGIAEEYRSREF